jgi:hypothetical protein
LNFIEVYLFLQLLDFLTTMIGLRIGATEGSPFIAWMMSLTTPMIGLAVAKGLALAWGALVLIRAKPKAMIWANYLFAVVVVFNLHSLAVTLAHLGY